MQNRSISWPCDLLTFHPVITFSFRSFFCPSWMEPSLLQSTGKVMPCSCRPGGALLFPVPPSGWKRDLFLQPDLPLILRSLVTACLTSTYAYKHSGRSLWCKAPLAMCCYVRQPLFAFQSHPSTANHPGILSLAWSPLCSIITRAKLRSLNGLWGDPGDEDVT